MYHQPKRELMERQQKDMNGFPGLMEKIKHEPDVNKASAGKQTSNKATPSVDSNAGSVAEQKKRGRPKKTVI